MIRYEWIAETVDELGDIQDVTHCETFKAANERAAELRADGEKVDVGLVRDQISDFDEDVENRQWAYLEDGRLPESFDGGARIPRRFFKEVEEGRA